MAERSPARAARVRARGARRAAQHEVGGRRVSEDTWDDGTPIGSAPVPIERGRQIRARKAKASSPELTELDLAERLIARAGEDLRYCADLGGWHAWTGSHWTLDKRETAREAVKDVARDLM